MQQQDALEQSAVTQYNTVTTSRIDRRVAVSPPCMQPVGGSPF